MTAPAAPEWSASERSYADAMIAEVDWAPLHFDGWGHYEQARPALPDETIEVIGRWADQGYTLQYRAVLGELIHAWQTPIDSYPEVTALGRIEESDLSELRSLAAQGQVDELSRAASLVVRTDRTIPTEPPVRTSSTIPDHEEVPVHYIPSGGRWLTEGQLFHEDHPSAAYAIAGHWGIRLGAPVGLTPTGLLVFQPAAYDELRITIEHPVSLPVAPRLSDARLGVYRYDGLGGWHQTATLHQPDEMLRLAPISAGAPIPMVETQHAPLPLLSPRSTIVEVTDA